MKNDKVKRLLYQSIEVIWGANLAWVGKSGNKELFDLETASLVHGDLETGLGNVILLTFPN